MSVEYEFIMDKEYANQVVAPDVVYPAYDQDAVLRQLVAQYLPDEVITSDGFLSTKLIKKLEAKLPGLPEAFALDDADPMVQVSVPIIRGRRGLIEPSCDPDQNTPRNVYGKRKNWINGKVIGRPLILAPKLGYYVLEQYEELKRRMALEGYTPMANACYGLAYILAGLVIEFPLSRITNIDDDQVDAFTSRTFDYLNVLSKGLTERGLSFITTLEVVKGHMTPYILRPRSGFTYVQAVQFLQGVRESSYRGPATRHEVMDKPVRGWGLGTKEIKMKLAGMYRWHDAEGKDTEVWPLIKRTLIDMGLINTFRDANFHSGSTEQYSAGDELVDFITNYRRSVFTRLINRIFEFRKTGKLRPFRTAPTEVKGLNTLLPNCIYCYIPDGRVAMVFSPQLPDGGQVKARKLKQVDVYHAKRKPLRVIDLLRRVTMLNIDTRIDPVYEEKKDPDVEGELTGNSGVPDAMKSYARELVRKPVDYDVNAVFKAVAMGQLCYSDNEVRSGHTDGSLVTFEHLINPTNLNCVSHDFKRTRRLKITHYATGLVLRFRTPRMYHLRGFTAFPSSVKQAVLESSGYFNYDVAACHPTIVYHLLMQRKEKLIQEYNMLPVTHRAAMALTKTYLDKNWTNQLLNTIQGEVPGLINSMVAMAIQTQLRPNSHFESSWLCAREFEKVNWDVQEWKDLIEGECKMMFISLLYGSKLNTEGSALRYSRVLLQTITNLMHGLILNPNALSEDRYAAMMIKVVEFSFNMITVAEQLVKPLTSALDALLLCLIDEHKVKSYARHRINPMLMARSSARRRKEIVQCMKQHKRPHARAFAVRNAMGQQAYFYQDDLFNNESNKSERSQFMHFITCGIEQKVMMDFNMKHMDKVVAQEHDGVMTNVAFTEKELAEFTAIAKREVGVPLILKQKPFA